MSLEELETAIRTVHAGSRHIPTAIAVRLAERMASSDLTSREMEVLELIVRGQSNKEIGASLTISEATVKSRINNILSKLGVTDRTQAVTTALQRGLVHLR
jgi:two-component system NarL family response regulator